MSDIDGLFRKVDKQPNVLTDAQVMQQQMKEFNLSLAKEQNERQEKRSATSCVSYDMDPSPDRLKNVKSSQINCAGCGATPAIRSKDLDVSEALRRALGTVQQLLEKRSGNYKPTQDDEADEGLMKSKSKSRK